MTDKISANVPNAARKQVKEANRLFAESQSGPADMTAAPPPDATPVTAPPVPTAEELLRAAEHKYNVLAGKYNAETSRLMGRAEALQAENAQLLARATAPVAAPARKEDTFNTSVVTPKEREEFGEELVDMMARIAKANSSAEVERLTRELNQMRGQVQQTVQVATETRHEKIWAQLATHVPGWQTINVSQQFVDWLQDVDVMSGQPRSLGLTNAFEAGDGPRVVGIFKRFIEEDSRIRSTSQDPATTAQVNRETLIAPGSPRGSGGEAPNGANKRLVSEQEIDDFYSRVQRKRISPEEKQALEAEYHAAAHDGRIVPRHNTQHLSNRS